MVANTMTAGPPALDEIDEQVIKLFAMVMGGLAAATDAFLADLATRIAVGLAAVVAVLDPPLVVLAGEVGRTGGPALATAVTAALEQATPLRTTVAASTVTGDAALIGALQAGLRTVVRYAN